jgi:pimeloyl-ACP methyl ester carboxylesterase
MQVGKVALVAILLGALALAAAMFFFVRRDSILLTNPPGYRHPLGANFQFEATPLSAHGLEFEELSLEAAPGAIIRGWLIPASGERRDLAVIALHGRGGDRQNHMPIAPLLYEAGAATALIDLRENGLSHGAGRGAGLGMREAEDALATARELRVRGYSRIILLGCSLGASAALIAAARDPDIAGVIAESPLESMGAYVRDNTAQRLQRHGVSAPWFTALWADLIVETTRARLKMARLESPIEVIADIAPRPVLIIGGDRDQATPLLRARRLAERGGVTVRLISIAGADHCSGFAAAPKAYESAVRALLEELD